MKKCILAEGKIRQSPNTKIRGHFLKCERGRWDRWVHLQDLLLFDLEKVINHISLLNVSWYYLKKAALCFLNTYLETNSWNPFY